MKAVVNNKNLVVAYIGEYAERTEVGIDVGSYIIARPDDFEIVDLTVINATIPANYKPDRYLLKNGVFELNPNYNEERKVEDLEEQLSNLDDAVQALILSNLGA